MCGICGMFEFEQRRPVSRDALASMLAVLYHRGPDDGGTYITGDVALGMRRLSIIDVEGGRQPITNEDGTVVVVFNGEIYNHRELRQRLEGRHHFSTAADTEVLVHLYEDLGEEFVSELRGMFAFALWDVRNRKLILARDRLGIKPVYYAASEGRLVFASEIKALLRHPGIQAQADYDALGQFLSLKYVPAPRTMFKGVRALEPGTVVSCDREGVRTRRYWDLSFAPDHRYSDERAAEERLTELLREAVRMHLMSDVPFGAFLSGGIDSSLIVALMSEALDRPVRTYAVGFGGDEERFSELPYARLVAERFGTEHHEVIVGGQEFVDHVQDVIWHLDQPVGDTSVVANYLVARLASHDVKMVLTGEGGDELFAGYARYAGERFAPVFRLLPEGLKSALRSRLDAIPGLHRPKVALYALMQPDELSRWVNWFPLFNDAVKHDVLAPALRQPLESDGVRLAFARELERCDARDSISRMLYVDTKLWLADDLLARGDKMSMAVSVEARVPLLDHKVVEFAASLPPHLKLKGLQRKYLLRKVAAGILPQAVITRKKNGFVTPISVWLRGAARQLVHDSLSPEQVRRRGLLNPETVNRLVQQHESGSADHGALIWGLLSIELWHQAFLDQAARPRIPQPSSAASTHHAVSDAA